MTFYLKQYETLRARAALAGVALSPTQDDRGRDSFIAAAGPLIQSLDTLDDATVWLDGFCSQGRTLVTAGGEHE